MNGPARLAVALVLVGILAGCAPPDAHPTPTPTGLDQPSPTEATAPGVH